MSSLCISFVCWAGIGIGSEITSDFDSGFANSSAINPLVFLGACDFIFLIFVFELKIVALSLSVVLPIPPDGLSTI